MRAKACSWTDIHRIREILANPDRLPGAYAALMRCADKRTRSDWRRSIEVLEACEGPDIRTLEHTQPSHALEIARHAAREKWGEWVERCEKEKWIVPALRSALFRECSDKATVEAEKTVPVGRYRTIVIDPPWAFGNKSGRQKPGYADRMMSLEDVAGFNIQRWVMEDGCHLYLWVVDAYAGDVYQVTRAWGFDPKAWLVWVKDRIGMGNYFRHQHEVCVFAVRGKMRLKRMDAPTVFAAKNVGHSVKPEEFYSIVESCSPGPYLDVFARRKRAGWDVFGDEVSQGYQMRLDGENESARVEEDA